MASEDVASMFAGLKKKSKKPKVAFAEEPAAPADADPTYPPKEPIDDPALGPVTAHERALQSSNGDAAPVTEPAADGDDVKNMFADMKKKKKEKAVTIDEGDAPAPVADGGESFDFSEMKKKKKTKKKVMAMEDFEKELGDEPAATPAPAQTTPAPAPKPKKAKKIVEESDGEEAEEEANDETNFEYNEVDEEELGENPFVAGAGGIDAEPEAWLGSDRDYTYEELLSRFFRVLHAANPSLASSSSKRYTLAPPSIHREGNKKSVFANIGDICRRMHREPAHVIAFLYAELGTTGSIDGSGRLIIKGKFQQKQIENILRRYIMEYVTCRTCKSPNTLLTKETRISFITCETCGSRQSVSAIKTGYQAQVGKRKKQQV